MQSDKNGEPGVLDQGGYLTLPEAAASLPSRPHLSTLHRWRLRGIRGVRLRTCLIGGRRFTRPEWLHEFVIASSHAGESSRPPGAAPTTAREQAVSSAHAALDAAGI